MQVLWLAGHCRLSVVFKNPSSRVEENAFPLTLNKRAVIRTTFQDLKIPEAHWGWLLLPENRRLATTILFLFNMSKYLPSQPEVFEHFATGMPETSGLVESCLISAIGYLRNHPCWRKRSVL